MKLKIIQSDSWSGGGHSLSENVKLAQEKHPQLFDENGMVVVMRNMVSTKMLITGQYIYMPQNAWAWHGPARGLLEICRRTILRVVSEIAVRRAYRIVRIGPMIPDSNAAYQNILPNSLDRQFEVSLESSQSAPSPSWMPNTPYMVVPGSIWSYRNLDAVIDAYQLYKSRGGALKLLIVGPMDNNSGASHIVSRCKQIDSITVISHKVSRQDALKAICNSKICIFSSLVEASPVTVLEAAALGIPTIAWDTPAYRFIVEHEKLNGVRFCDSVNSLAELMAAPISAVESEINTKQGREARRQLWADQFVKACGAVEDSKG